MNITQLHSALFPIVVVVVVVPQNVHSGVSVPRGACESERARAPWIGIGTDYNNTPQRKPGVPFFPKTPCRQVHLPGAVEEDRKKCLPEFGTPSPTPAVAGGRWNCTHQHSLTIPNPSLPDPKHSSLVSVCRKKNSIFSSTVRAQVCAVGRKFFGAHFFRLPKGSQSVRSLLIHTTKTEPRLPQAHANGVQFFCVCLFA